MKKIKNKTIIHRVYEQVKEILEHVIIATDHKEIFNHVKSFGGTAIMTSVYHTSGTDRCAEAIDIYSKQINKKFDIIINIQGDEAFINPEQIKQIISCFDEPATQIATLIKIINSNEELFDTSIVKVVINSRNHALYFSRTAIPFYRNIADCTKWLKHHNYYKHIGIYAYKYKILKEIACLNSTSLEKAEALEQLRWLENGYKIKTFITQYDSFSIDTPEDLKKAQTMI